MRRNIVGLVWLAGLVLAVFVYEAGPDRILYRAVHLLDGLRDAVNAILAAFAINTFDVMRALSLALVPVFVVLAALANRRGVGVARTVVVVAVLVLALLYVPVREGYYVSGTRWLLAFLVVGIGCLSLTRRLGGGGLLPAGVQRR